MKSNDTVHIRSRRSTGVHETVSKTVTAYEINLVPKCERKKRRKKTEKKPKKNHQ